MVWFMRFSYYKTANRTVPCGVVRCGALLLAIQCGYAILQAILMRFMRLMRFERYEVSIFFKFWFFPTHPKTNFFPLFLVKF